MAETQSTPHNKGTASHTWHRDSKNTRATYNEYLKEDIANEHELSIENFVEAIFQCDNWTELVESQKVQGMKNDSEFISRLAAYGNFAGEESPKEDQLYHSWVQLANYVLESEGSENTITVCRNDPLTVRGSQDARKPDVLGTLRDAITKTPRISASIHKASGPKKTPFHWLEILWYIEFKLKSAAKRKMLTSCSVADIPPKRNSDVKGSKHKTGSKRRARTIGDSDNDSQDSAPDRKRSKIEETEQPEQTDKLQCASYALEMLSNGGLRTHALGFYINGCDLQVQYFDRSIFTSSTSFSIKEDPSKFIALLFVLQSLTPRQWGFMPRFECPIHDPTLRVKTGLRADDFLNKQIIKLNNGSKLEVGDILSRHHGLIGRGTTVVRARLTDANQNSVVAVKISSPATTRRNERDILQIAYEKATGQYGRMRDHLPAVLHWEDIEYGDTSPQETLVRLLKRIKYEPRSLRIIAFRELHPIHKLKKAPQLSQVFRDVFNCYRWLYEEAKILHRDISLDNIMYYHKDGKICGVLNDFDLATLVGDTSPSSKQRTGTKLFMACDVLSQDGIPHIYQYDLESLYYVILFLTSRFMNGKEIKDPPLQRWFSLSAPALANNKLGMLNGPRGLGPPLPTAPFRSFTKWLDPMHQMFLKGLHGPDVATRQKEITFDKMADIFKLDLPTSILSSSSRRA